MVMMVAHPEKRRSIFSVIFIVCCGLLVLVVAMSEASRIERNSTETFRRVTRDRRHYCGKTLTSTLAMVCNSYPTHGRKKSDPTISSEDSFEGSYREQLISEIKQDLDELEELGPEILEKHPMKYRPFLYYPRTPTYPEGNHHRTALEGSLIMDDDPMETGYQRVRRQIVEECCRKSCSLQTLKQYCAN